MRILIVTDGSSYAEAALHLGAHLLRGSLTDEPPTVLAAVKHEVLRPQANDMLTTACALLGTSDLHTTVRIGDPAEKILQEAEEGQYGLILIGDRLSGDWIGRLLRGSPAVEVAQRARCPVLVAKGRVGPPCRILLCDSGAKIPSESESDSLSTRAETGAPRAPWPTLLSRFTAKLAELLEGEEEITVLHVMSQISAGPGVRGKQLRASAEELIGDHTPEGALLAQDLRILEKPHVRAYAKVRHGLVLDEILDEARSGDYDLVVIGAHPGGGWQHLLLDDLAHQIILRLDRPVLVVH